MDPSEKAWIDVIVLFFLFLAMFRVDMTMI